MNSFNNVGKVNIIEGSGGGLLVLALIRVRIPLKSTLVSVKFGRKGSGLRNSNSS